ncbi:hypothetical protein ACDH60_10265 [Pseudomonas ficuserectae]|uniref:Uncharacterized protein n=1 Tax=Pseudomonas amygdali pv. lachrymans TaxID=53707 RepID=A0AB37R3A4_PSEAV|nr:hypothetical protein [Pseudomonas amygdali]ARA79618.1 hypothetical protein B5U27_05800 [Pseudomonas amygdali pv. lachrymans]KKY57463.1 hypothetical protein AAY85_13170 [Pseudomonas amygdali pv. lachrymans]KPC01798.1 Uncharacterized protein AC501_3081 [Pseudomonas amygdali pv. lachrymans]KPC19942.1 Uncharacterized protein AC499_2410 [Pseudomonas amygdali pv. lachrymans]QWA49157.1 hypothetical protein C4C37_21585 [Pseudomonas amygdali pv. lachrymans]
MTDTSPMAVGAELKLDQVTGFTSGFMLDPLEQAIESTVRMLRDEHQQMKDMGAVQDTPLSDRLGSHLDALLAIQIQRVSGDEDRSGPMTRQQVE